MGIVTRAQLEQKLLGGTHCVCAGTDLAGNITAFFCKLEASGAPALAEVETVASWVFSLDSSVWLKT